MADQSNAAFGRTPVAIQLVSFAKDILPLFRPLDIEHMQAFDVRLDDYTYMSDASNNYRNATAVRDFLSGARQPRMPIGGPFWTEEQLALFERWMTGGFLP